MVQEALVIAAARSRSDQEFLRCADHAPSAGLKANSARQSARELRGLIAFVQALVQPERARKSTGDRAGPVPAPD